MAATKMLFRTVKNGDFAGTVDAVILDAPANPGCVLTYSHIGQHSEASWAYYLERTRRATKSERAPLIRELARIYGPIKVMQRRVKG